MMEKIVFNEGWNFSSEKTKSVKQVTVPHDAMLEEERSESNPSGSAGAYFAGGRYIYEKHFMAPKEWEGQQVILRFEGIFPRGEIFINGQKAGDVLYGYAGKDVEISALLHYGEENTVMAVAESSAQPASRWYSGAGLCRPVTLFVLAKDRIDLDGIRVETLDYSPARIRVRTSSHGEGEVRISVLKDGAVKAQGEGSDTELVIPDALLWDAEHPERYTLKADLVRKEDGEVLDTREVRFGIRKIAWSPEGLFVNGRSVLLKGGCIHHDNGILGACAFPEAEKRRIRIMKENGFNAIRSAHNPCSSSMLDACDELGMYMMDEGWDMWYRHKSKEDYAKDFPEHWKEDAEAMIRKDMLHPSVILYSIGNEVSEPAEQKGLALEKELVAFFHDEDPTRPVTCGMNLMILANAAKGQQMYDGNGNVNAGSGKAAPMDSTKFNEIAQMVGAGMNHAADSDEADAAISPAMDALDIAGYNYGAGRYPLDAVKHPDRVIVGTETLPPDLYDNWEMVKKYKGLVGDFMWTGWDYLGEAGIGAWSDREDAGAFNKPYPWLLGGSGVINIIGDPDGEALLARTIWQDGGVYLAVRPVSMDPDKTFHSVWRNTNAIPSWSYTGCEGKKAVAEVYGSGAFAELYLNGTKLGEKPLEKNRAVFETVYQPGTLSAVVRDAKGEVIGETSLSSAEGPLFIRIILESEAKAGELLYVHIDLAGNNGVIDSAADEKLRVSVEGGTLLGFGSANPCTEESYVTGVHSTYRGRSLAVIRPSAAGDLVITVTGERKSASRHIRVEV